MPVDTALHKAAHQGDDAQVQEIISSGEVEVNAPGAAERRALHRAAGAGHTSVCKLLAENGATIDVADKAGRTALHWAAISGHAEVIKFLLEKGADVMAATKSKMTPLHAACEAGHKEVVVLLINAAKDQEALFNAQDGDGKTPCDLAVGGKNKAVVEELKKMGDKNAASAACTIQ